MLPAPDQDNRTGDLRMTFTATAVAVRESLAQMLTVPPLCRLPRDARSKAELVLAEVLNNVSEHAYADGSWLVTVSLEQTGRGLCCVIVDQGKPMPGGALPEGRLPVDPDMALDDLPEGGFGWHLIHSLTSDLSYIRGDGSNRLRFVLP